MRWSKVIFEVIFLKFQLSLYQINIILEVGKVGKVG